jgi:hypothetical protein
MATMMLAVVAAGAYCWLMRDVVRINGEFRAPIEASRVGLVAVTGLFAFWAPVELAGRPRSDPLPSRLIQFAVAACPFAAFNVWAVLAVILLVPAAAIFHLPVAIGLMQQGPEGKAELKRTLKGLWLVTVEVAGLAVVYMFLIASMHSFP